MRAKDITVESLVAELEEARAGAERVGNASAAVQASVVKAKLLGLMVDKQEVRTGAIENMTEQELRDYLASDDISPLDDDAAPTQTPHKRNRSRSRAAVPWVRSS